MKITKQIVRGFCFLICGLLLALPAKAQETNQEPVHSQTAAVTVTVSNATGTVAINENADTNDNPDAEEQKHPQPIVLFGQNAELKTNETADAVVVIGGSAKIHGHVQDAVVVIGGDAEVDGQVGDAVVAIFGNVHIEPGAKIRSDAVAMLGTVSVAPGAKIGGDAVAIGGKLDIADEASVKGDKVNIGLPGPLANLDWLRNWLKYCAFEFRPLAPQVGFVWIIAAVFFLVYLLIAAVFPKPVQVCVADLDRRPATLFLIGLLTKLLVPFLYLILGVTGIGLIVVPFIWVSLFLCAVVGKIAILEWLGFKIAGHFGDGLRKPLPAFLIGILLITLLYMVPVVGLLTSTLFSVFGLGCGVSAYFAHIRRETLEKPVPPATPMAPAVPAQPSTFVPPVIGSNIPPTPETAATSGTAAAAGGATAPPLATVPPIVPPVFPEAASFPKANLWERLCAAFLDLILICIVSGLAHIGTFSLIVALAYFAGMWTWRGTTIGGIVLKLKVVRTDGRPLNFVVALVRGLAAAFSTVIFFLGFLWIVWDKDKQGWHDKIAGTSVIRLPYSVPLVML